MTQQQEPTVWLVPHGSDGEHEQPALDRGVALLGFTDIPDLTGRDENDIEDLLNELDAYASNSAQSRGTIAGMMKAFALKMRVNDLVAVPLKKQPGQVALGRIDSGYLYQPIDGANRHTRKVEWIARAVPKAEFGPDAANFLIPKMTVSRIRYAELAAQIRVRCGGEAPELPAPTLDADEDPGSLLPIHALSREQIIERIHQRFPARELERLVAAVLKCQGFVVQQAGPGRDLGVDVLAGHGPLGFDPPRICVQVKHTAAPSGHPEVQQLHGAMQQFGAEQALFVSWNDYTGDAKQMARLNYFSMRLWNASDLLNEICRVYDQLPGEIRSEIPLQQIWTLVPDDDL